MRLPWGLGVSMGMGESLWGWLRQCEWGPQLWIVRSPGRAELGGLVQPRGVFRF